MNTRLGMYKYCYSNNGTIYIKCLYIRLFEKNKSLAGVFLFRLNWS